MESTAQGLTVHQVLIALTSKIDEVVLKVHYEQIDEKNHKSLEALSHFMSSAGYPTVATFLEEQKPYIVFSSVAEAQKCHDLINGHSTAIHTQVYYQGLQDEEAEKLIYNKTHKQESHIIHKKF
jgi:hypothetical protein